MATETKAARSIPAARVAGGLGKRVLKDARYFADDKRSIIGYAIVGLYGDGSPFVASATEWGKRPINRHMFVGMASELIRDDMITDETARHIVNRSNGFVD